MRPTFAGFSSRVSNFREIVTVLVVSAFVAIAAASPASANERHAAYLLDANTGQVLYARNSDARRYPASLTKMMTLYMVFEAIEAKRITTNTQVPFSKNAAAEPPTKLGVRAGGSISVDTAIKALVTRSANDVATALGEMIGGSEANFARLMTAKAKQLGMGSTQFRNAHGLPNAQQYTTARDMAILGVALREHFPRHYSYFSTRSFNYGKQRINSHNRMFGRVEGVDGIKTGYTNASGFNIVTSIQDNGRSVVAVVMGGASARSRDDQMTALLRDHLPKASRRDGGKLIAARQLTPGSAVVASAASAAFALPHRDIPMPSFRPGESRPAATQADLPVIAYAQESAASSVPMPTAAPAAARSNPVPPMPVASVPVPTFSEDRMAASAVDPMVTASTQQSGWVVQIASSPSQGDAFAALVRTGKDANRVVGSANAFIEEFNNKGTTYYRARFGGFASKDQAWNACSALKKQKIDCFAVQL